VTPVDEARGVLASAIESRVFPGATLDVGNAAGPIWREALGRRTFDHDAPATNLETLFDLASLTKVVATTSVLMELVGRRTLNLDAKVAAFFPEWRGADREPVTVRDLLEHASGLPARLIDPPPSGRREFEHDIAQIPLEYAPRTRALYSDLDFILLGLVGTDVGGEPLDQLFARLAGGPSLLFNPPPAMAREAAPTEPLAEDLRRGRRLVGEVHDNYAAALGGVAGHAGLFGTAPAVGAFARTVLGAARTGAGAPPFTGDLVRLFTTRSTVPGSSRALGWDTMLPTSSCGTRMSASAFGHVGFTGTSLWIDPVRDRYFVLLTNRVTSGGSSDDMQRVRRKFHDALGDL
jgi:CubicO group peptidase (beta-lactamase class C family)